MRIARILLLCLLIAPLSACDRSPPTSDNAASANTAQVGARAAQAAARPKVVALILKAHTNPYFIALEQGARQAEKENGITLITNGSTQDNYVQEQVQVVEEAIRAKVDAIVIAPSDSSVLVPALKKAQDAGIVMVVIDNPLDPAVMQNQHLDTLPLVTIDNEAAGYKVVKSVVDGLRRPTKAAVVEGMPGAENGRLRVEGALRALHENRLVKVVARDTAEWRIDQAYALAKKLFAEHPDLSLVFCANDMMALGVAHYINEHHLNNVLVIGYDALDEAKEEIRAGRLTATLDQQADQQGYQAVVFATRLMRGEKVPDVFLVNTKVVNAASLR